MVEGKSPFELSRDLQSQIDNLLSGFDVDSLRPAEREILAELKRQAIDVRLEIREYGMAETGAAQAQAASEARIRLKQFEETIAQAGGNNLFGPVDVAQLSAIIGQLAAGL